MSGPVRPRVRTVTVEVEGYDGDVVRFTYRDRHPDQQPDASTGIELEVATDTTRETSPYGDQFRIISQRHTHRITIENSPTWTTEIIPATMRTRADRVTPAALPAATPALEAPDA